MGGGRGADSKRNATNREKRKKRKRINNPGIWVGRVCIGLVWSQWITMDIVFYIYTYIHTYMTDNDLQKPCAMHQQPSNPSKKQ